MNADYLLEAQGVSFGYRAGESVLHDVSLGVRRGETLCLLGLNGAGKTTLLNILAGLAQPHAGRIRLEGRDIASLTPAQIARHLAYVPQSTDPTFAYTLRDFVVMGRTPHLPRFASPGRHDYEIADAALARLGLAELGGRALTEVSGGQRQKATIARALAQQPEAILFDEPTAHLDFGAQLAVVELMRSLADEGYAVVMTTHSPAHPLMLDDQVALLDAATGALETGYSRELLSAERLSELYRVRVTVGKLEGISYPVVAAELGGS